jgi:hypothetical protein
MNMSEAKKYFQTNPDAKLIVVPRRYKYLMQVHHDDVIRTIKSRLSQGDIQCDTMEQINEHARKLNKLDYELIQSCPHVEMSGLDEEGQTVAHRQDAAKIMI